MRVVLLLLMSGCTVLFPLEDRPPPTPYQDAVLADAPVAYWRLDEESGAAVVDTIGAHDGIFIGTPTLGAAGALAVDPDTAAEFGGPADGVSVNDADALRLNGSWSIELWVRALSDNIIDFPAIIAKGQPQQTGWVVYINDAAQPVFKRAAIDGKFTDATVSAEFQHFVLTFDGTKLQWYVDGVAERSHLLLPVESVDSAPLYLATESPTANNSSIALDEVALYKTALSPDRVQAHFLAAE